MRYDLGPRTAASGKTALAAILVILAIAAAAAAFATPAHATLPGGGGGGGDSCTLESDYFDDYASNGTIGIQMHIKCSNSGALIKGTIACIQQYVAGYGGVQSWRNGECWAGQGYGVLVLGGFQACHKSTGSYPSRGEASFNVTFPDGYQITYSPFTREAGEPCLIF